jgi:alpha-beta hydrolase superfamily lysophospholipase
MSPLAGGLSAKLRLVSRDAAGPAGTSQDQPERDECSHNVLTRGATDPRRTARYRYSSGQAIRTIAILGQVLASRSDVVLVVHSMGGLVARLVLEHRAVASLAMLAAMVPSPGATWLDDGPRQLAPRRRGCRS